ncbi:MAG: tetratricopeptide repeat protein [Sedimenticola sp.]
MTEQLPHHGIAVYNPAILNREELKRYFVARRALLEKMLEGLRREQPGKTPQHRLIVGIHGMGKTTLLHRFALAVKEESSLDSVWLPLTFPEEQYNISRLSDFWVNCLDALGDSLEEAGKETFSNELEESVDALPEAEEARAAKALQVLLSYPQRLGKRLLLLVDNLDIVLDRLAESHGVIRELLDHEPHLLLIGASLRVLETTIEYDAAFYDFFKIHELKGLSEKEISEFLRQLAEVDNNSAITHRIAEEPARLHTLYTLTGGNPRTAVLLYGMLAQGIYGDVRSDLERLLDHCTPLYKARFEEFSPQAQKVVDAMAIYWDPLTAGNLAKQVRLPVNTVSTQLTRLERQGVVEKVPLRPGRKHGFQIAERFFNIWYLMRTNRRVRRRLIWLVQFLKVFYSQDELQVRADCHLQNRVTGRGNKSLRHAEFAFCLACVVEDRTTQAALESSALPTMMSLRARHKALGGVIDLDGDDAGLKTQVERIAFIKELPELIAASRTQWPKEVDVGQLTKRLVDCFFLPQEIRQAILSELPSMNDDKLVKFDLLLRTSVNQLNAAFSLDSALHKTLKKAVHEGLIDGILDPEGLRVAAKLYQQPVLAAFAGMLELISSKENTRFSTTELQNLFRQFEKYGISCEWNKLGLALKKRGDLRVSIELFRKQLEVKPDHETARVNLAAALAEQGDLLAAIEELHKQLDVEPDHETALVVLGLVLTMQGNLPAAKEALDKQLDIRPDHEYAWTFLGYVLSKQGDLTAAIKAHHKQLEIKPDHELAWGYLAITLVEQGDLTAAIAAYREGMSYESTKGRCHNYLAWSYYLWGEQLIEAEALAREAVAIDLENLDYRNTLATLLLCNDKWPEAKAEAQLVFEQVGERLLESTWSELQLFFREAVTKGYTQEVVELLRETGAAERWRPLYTALKAVVEGKDQFTRVAPEVRRIAEELFEQITSGPQLSK